MNNAGLKEADMSKPQVGVASMWYEGNPCNMHLLKLAEEVKKGVEEAGLVAYRFNTIGVSDGISMGTGARRRPAAGGRRLSVLGAAFCCVGSGAVDLVRCRGDVVAVVSAPCFLAPPFHTSTCPPLPHGTHTLH